jgi:hypothetical protein
VGVVVLGDLSGLVSTEIINRSILIAQL